MSSISFPGAFNSPSAVAQTTSAGSTASKAASATTSQATGHLQEDTVKLSIAAQAKLMHRQGLSPSVIAANLGTNVASIDGYLNIKVAPQTAAAATTSSATAESKPISTSTATTEAASTEASGQQQR